MAEQDEAKAAAYAEFIKEKAMVDEIIAKIMEEEKQEALAKMAKRKETIEYVRSYLEDNERLKEEEKRRQAHEDEEILRYAEGVRAREGAHAAAKAELDAEKDRIFNKISKDILRKQAEEEEMLELQIELANQESEERKVQDDRAALEKRLRDRMEMMAANEYQKRLKMERLKQQQEEEDDFRKKMLDKFAEDARIEQMNAQKRRMKVLEHKKEVERLLDERRSMYESEKAAELQEQEEEGRRAAALRSLIEQERQRILQVPKSPIHVVVQRLHVL
ncbi:tumor suppressor, Mitostatin-domain-containing protein [Baffinella frigidus]|nr:tumor suppressor, Mitostatin-domain-containing protein [Cryptophyta sp. CCMP2293]